MQRLVTVIRVGILVFFGLISAGFLSAQVTVDNNELQVIPPAPSVAQLGKYNLASVHLSDGSFSTQIPVYTYKTKNLAVPIILNYSTNGLIVNKVAGRVGMDWTMTAGGSISRMVLGAPDELKSYPVFPSDFPNTTGDSLQIFLTNLQGGNYETTPDIYSFNFNGETGRFLSFNNQIIKLEQNNLLIVKTAQGFQITDGDGVVYTFDQTETSLSSSNCTGNPYSGGPPVKNAWMLSQISHPLGDIIYIKYKTCNYTYSTGVSQTYMTAAKSSTENVCNTPAPVMQLSRQCIEQTTNSELIVDKIYSNARGVVIFNYTNRSDMPADSALSWIGVYDDISDRFGNLGNPQDILTTPVHYYEFDYNFPTATTGFTGSGGTNYNQRMFLTGFISDDKNYIFQYNNLNQLPPRLSFCQDQFGYFNGKNNASLIPAPTDVSDYNLFLSYGYGNRLPDYTYALKGAMNKITYPTGGYDSIVYESHSVYKSGSFNCSNLNVTYRPDADGPSALKTSTKYYSDAFTVHCGQTINLEVANIPLDGKVDYPTSYYSTISGLITVPDGVTIPPSATYTYGVDNVGQIMQAHVQEDNTYHVTINPGTYRIMETVQGPSRGFADFNYQDDTSASGNISIAGIRVKQIISNSFNTIPLVKQYYYSVKGTSNSSGQTVDQFPVYLSVYHQIIAGGMGPTCNQATPPGCYSVNFQYNKYSSNDFYNIYTYTGNHIYYQTVTEDFGNNFANGYIEHDFQVVSDQSSTMLVGGSIAGTPLSSWGIYNGFEYQTRYYKNVDTAFILSKETDQVQYSDPRLSNDNPYYSIGFDAGFQVSCLNHTATTTSQFEGLHVSLYNMFGRWLYTDSLTSIDYDDKGNILRSVTNRIYNNPVHQLLSIESTQDSKGNVIKNNYFYPQDSITLTDPTALQAKWNLQKLHMYNEPLIKQFYNNSSEMQEHQNYYMTGSNSIPVLNKQWRSLLGDTLELRSQINKYGNKGNVLEMVSDRSDIESFIWDYQDEFPIAKVSNSAYADIAYTSFEADATGNWTVPDTNRVYNLGITGIKSYAITSAKTLSATVTGTTGNPYVVSYWVNSGGTNPALIVKSNGTSVGGTAGLMKQGWTYYEHVLPSNTTSVAITSSVAENLDELRLYPSNAQMISLTYLPLLGVSSICSPGNLISYYSYDGSGRLAIIQDMDKNIEKSYEYRYKISGYPFTNDLQQSTLTRNNCTGGMVGSSVTYSVPAGTYGSSVSKAQANLQAINDVTANAQTYANANGICTVPNEAVTATNSTNEQVNALFTNTVTASGTSFNIAPGASNLNVGTVPLGTYNVVFTPSAPVNTYPIIYAINSTSQTYYGAVTFSNTTINAPIAISFIPGCNATSCTGNANRCVNNVCQAGTKVYTSSVSQGHGTWLCTYHYLWSNGFTSGDYTETDSSSCPLTLN